VSWTPRPPVTVPWLRAIRELFTSDRAITSQGVGGNLVDLLAELVRAIDANTVEIRRFNDRREREDG
jgi:hypothetical protein